MVTALTVCVPFISGWQVMEPPVMWWAENPRETVLREMETQVQCLSLFGLDL